MTEKVCFYCQEVWIVPLKDKKGETVTEAFKTIFKEGRKPQYPWTDKRKTKHYVRA